MAEYSEADLFTELRAAHDAGDKEYARTVAAEIKRVRAGAGQQPQQPQPEQPMVGGQSRPTSPQFTETELFAELKAAHDAGNTERASAISDVITRMRAGTYYPKQKPYRGYGQVGGAEWGPFQEFGSSVIAGLGPEVMAAGAGIRGVVEGEDYLPTYRKAVRNLRAAQDQYRKGSPTEALAAGIGGALISPVALVGARWAAQAPTLIKAMGRGAVVGTGQAATYGAGETPGGLAERLTGAVEAAPFGAAFGVGAPVVGAAAKRVAAPIAERLARRKAGVSRGEKEVWESLPGEGAAAEKAASLAEKLKAEGAGAALLDVGDARAMLLGRGATHATEEGAEIGSKFVRERALQRPKRLREAAEHISPGSDFYDEIDELNKLKRQEARPLYEEAFAPKTSASGETAYPWSRELDLLFDDPRVKKAAKEEVEGMYLDAKRRGEPIPQEFGLTTDGELKLVPSLRVMDAAKRGLDARIGAHYDAWGNLNLTGNQTQTKLNRLISLKNDLVEELDRITTDPRTGVSVYKQARDAWAGPSNLEDKMKWGRRFAKGDAELTQRKFAKMSEGEKEAFVVGVKREVLGIMERDIQTAPGKFAEKKADLWQKLRNVLPPERFALFEEAMGQELRKHRIEGIVSPWAGSKTAGTIQDVERILGMGEKPMWAEMAEGAATSPGGPLQRAVGAVTPMLRKAWDSLFGMPDDEKVKVIRILAEMDPEAQAAFLAKMGGVQQPRPIMPTAIPTDEPFGGLAQHLRRGLAPQYPMQEGR